MSYMFEVYYRAPVNSKREAMLVREIGKLGGYLSHREHPTGTEAHTSCLTFEFDAFEQAESAAKVVIANGHHVEGPVAYGTEPSK